MDDDARRRIRRTRRAKQSASPKVRGQYKRAIHAARLEQEARGQTESGPRQARTRQTQPMLPIVPPPKRRRVAPLVSVSAAVPILILLAIGGYALNFAVHLDNAKTRVARTPLPR